MRALQGCASRRARCRCRCILLYTIVSHSLLVRLDGPILTYYGILIFARVVDVEEFASSQREGHALIVLLEVVVDFRCHKSSKLAIRERFLFVEALTAAKSVIVAWAKVAPSDRKAARTRLGHSKRHSEALTFDLLILTPRATQDRCCR